MSLSLAIAVNVLATVALLAGLAYAMSRTVRLTPHVASLDAAEELASAEPAPAARGSRRLGRSSRSSRLAGDRHAVPMPSHVGAQSATANES
jgi:hypothetical protein